MKTLEQIIKKHNLDKTDHLNGTDKYSIHQYIQKFYEKAFLNLVDNEIKLLEIGTCTGASLLVWKLFFEKGEIYGIDEKDLTQKQYIRNDINYLIFDAYDEKNSKHLNDFDIIIDDGLHENHSNSKAINIFFDKLKDGGLFIIEDFEHDHILINTINELKKKNPKNIGVIDNRNITNFNNSRLVWAIK